MTKIRKLSFKMKSLPLIAATLAISFSGLLSATAKVDIPQWQLSQIAKNPSLRGSAIKQNSLWVTGSNNSVFVSFD